MESNISEVRSMTLHGLDWSASILLTASLPLLIGWLHSYLCRSLPDKTYSDRGDLTHYQPTEAWWLYIQSPKMYTQWDENESNKYE